MGRLTFMPIVLLVAAVYDPAVLVGAVPNLGSEGASALAAFDFAGENAHAAVTSVLLLAPCYLHLDHLENSRRSDGRVPLLHKVTGNLSIILHSLLHPALNQYEIPEKYSSIPAHFIWRKKATEISH